MAGVGGQVGARRDGGGPQTGGRPLPCTVQLPPGKLVIQNGAQLGWESCPGGCPALRSSPYAQPAAAVKRRGRQHSRQGSPIHAPQPVASPRSHHLRDTLLAALQYDSRFYRLKQVQGPHTPILPAGAVGCVLLPLCFHSVSGQPGPPANSAKVPARQAAGPTGARPASAAVGLAYVCTLFKAFPTMQLCSGIPATLAVRSTRRSGIPATDHHPLLRPPCLPGACAGPSRRHASSGSAAADPECSCAGVSACS